jgi:hypothetical protein
LIWDEGGTDNVGCIWDGGDGNGRNLGCMWDIKKDGFGIKRDDYGMAMVSI